MTPFELLEPRSIRKAAALLDADDGVVRSMGGGTALMLMMKMGVLRPTRLVSLRAIEKRYSRISAMRSYGVRIGAMATLSEIERSPLVQRHAPVLVETLRTLSNVRVRNVATLGGHLAHADPHLDLPPVLIALNAGVDIVSETDFRTVPLEELYTGYLETTLARGELIAEVIVPRQQPRCAAYIKCTTRSADDWPALGIAVSLDYDGYSVRDARIVVSAATDTPTRLRKTEEAVRESGLSAEFLRHLRDIAASEVTLLGDAHGTAAYKKELLRVYVARAIRKAVEQR